MGKGSAILRCFELKFYTPLGANWVNKCKVKFKIVFW